MIVNFQEQPMRNGRFVNGVQYLYLVTHAPEEMRPEIEKLFDMMVKSEDYLLGESITCIRPEDRKRFDEYYSIGYWVREEYYVTHKLTMGDFTRKVARIGARLTMANGSIVRRNLLTIPGYTPYCGSQKCYNRAAWDPNLGQFKCSCGWVSQFDADFIKVYSEYRIDSQVCKGCRVRCGDKKNKYCGDGTDKDHSHRWELPSPGPLITRAPVFPDKETAEIPKIGSSCALRIWWMPQLGLPTFHYRVDTVAEGAKLLDALALYDLFQYDNKIKGDYANSGGLEIFDETDTLDGSAPEGSWVAWSDEDTGEDNPTTYLESLLGEAKESDTES